MFNVESLNESYTVVQFGHIAQQVERHPVKVMVVGSNPSVPATKSLIFLLSSVG